MELIIFIAALCVVGILAVRFGSDSRPTAQSKEEDLASLGVTSPARQPMRRSKVISTSQIGTNAVGAIAAVSANKRQASAVALQVKIGRAGLGATPADLQRQPPA
jgi:hypothetical protein